MAEKTFDTSDENRYLKRFEAEFRSIMSEIDSMTNIIPQYKNENESLRERISNIRGWAEVASKIRYMNNADADALLANLISQILMETDKLDELKPINREPDIKGATDDLYQLLTKSKAVDMESAFAGFDFYDNNPLKQKAEKKIKKMKKARGK